MAIDPAVSANRIRTTDLKIGDILTFNSRRRTITGIRPITEEEIAADPNLFLFKKTPADFTILTVIAHEPGEDIETTEQVSTRAIHKQVIRDGVLSDTLSGFTAAAE